MRIAFLGLGHMGEPMASNLVRSGADVTVWNRSEAATRRLSRLGASIGGSAQATLRGADVALLMLANEAAIDEVVGRGTAEFAENASGRLVVNMGTTSPAYSASLGNAIQNAGGRYVEAPVSGSRKPAEQAALVGMVAGDDVDVELVRDVVAPMCRQTFACGAVPGALTMKLAVNLFLITMVTGLVEASHFALNSGLDLDLFRSIVDAGPMASDVSSVKLDKIVRCDMDAQARLSDVLMNSGLIYASAREAAIATPLLDQSHQLFAEADGMGFGELDMIGVAGAIEQLTAGRMTDRILAAG